MASLSEDAYKDLRSSGLSDASIIKLHVRSATVADIPFAAKAFVIPYFLPGEEGGYTPLLVGGAHFTRAKILSYEGTSSLNGDRPKYYQAPSTGTHIYFPPLVEAEHWWDISRPLILVEGEKKAACATQYGYLCAGLGGVDSWRSRKLQVSQKMLAGATDKMLTIDLDAEGELKIENMVCEELISLPLEDREVLICYDTEPLQSKVDKVFRAAFDLGLWLESQGAHARQIILPPATGGKNALDDFLMRGGDLRPLIKGARFPRRPGIRSWVRRQLGNPKRPRNTLTGVSRGILSELDHRGTRFRDPFGIYYYFDKRSDTLYSMPIETARSMAQAAPKFHQMLVRDFGISSADRDVIQRLEDDFESLPPLTEVPRVYKQSHAADKAFYYQLSDSKVAKVTKDGIVQQRNGTDGILFEVGARDVALVRDVPKTTSWLTVLPTTSLQPMSGMTLQETHLLTACLFYLSPWLRRWRGLMLPAELAVSEAGSGKSSLYQLRHNIFTGTPRLQHQPEDIKAWYSSIADAQGMWVADNVGTKLDPRISNEIARLITDPDPAFELRELYTTSKIHRMPVDCTFNFTAIYNPFHRPDMLQRSMLMEFHAIKDRDGGWLQRQISGEGRAQWVTHHLQMISRFLQIADKLEWGVSTKHRLIGFEQSLRCMGIALGQRTLVESALSKLPGVVQNTISAQEPIVEALKAYTRMRKRRSLTDPFELDDAAEWVRTMERFSDLRVFKNTRLLERYISAHQHDVYAATGIRITRQLKHGFPLYIIDLDSPQVQAMTSDSSNGKATT